MRIVFIVLCFLLTITANSQLNSLTYRLHKTDGTHYTGKIVAEKQNAYFIRLANDSLSIVYKKDVTTVYVIDNNGTENNVTGYSKKQIKQLEQNKLNEIKHNRWDSCFIVALSGDTFRGRIETNHFYTDLVSIKFLGANGREREIYYADIKEFYLYNRLQGENHYIVLNNRVGYNVLYKVLKEGKCMLLYRISYTISTATGLTGFSAYSLVTFGQDQVDRYFIYYKGEVTPIKTEYANNLFSFSSSIDFKNKCRNIFADCPELLADIENENPKGLKLDEVVESYNKCLGKN